MIGADVVWFCVGLVLGIFFGLNMYNDRKAKDRQKAYEQIDEQVRKDLVRYRNLSESLLEDVKFWRHRANTLRDIKEKK